MRFRSPYRRQTLKITKKNPYSFKVINNTTNSNQNNEDQIWNKNSMKDNNEGLN